MKKLLFFAPFLVLILSSCKPSQNKIDKVELVQNYIKALNEFDYEAVVSKLQDSVRLKEIVYESIFTHDQYYQLFQWDSIFQPKYEILEIAEAEDGTVKMQVSKQGPRILFLNKQPIVTDEVVRFENHEIHSVEITNYAVFDEVTWTNTRKELLDWIATNHPELNGFLHDQTRQGALNYMKALEYYQANH